MSGYRYYSPELGRWVNRDPLLDPCSVPVILEQKQLLRLLEVQSLFSAFLALNEDLPIMMRLFALHDWMKVAKTKKAINTNEPILWHYLVGDNGYLFCANDSVYYIDLLGLSRGNPISGGGRHIYYPQGGWLNINFPDPTFEHRTTSGLANSIYSMPIAAQQVVGLGIVVASGTGIAVCAGKAALWTVAVVGPPIVVQGNKALHWFHYETSRPAVITRKIVGFGENFLFPPRFEVLGASLKGGMKADYYSGRYCWGKGLEFGWGYLYRYLEDFSMGDVANSCD